MMITLYKRRQKDLVLDPKEFNKILESANPDLKGFFAKMCNILIPNDRSSYNQNEDKKQIVVILYLMAELQNKYINSFKLELALYLAGSRTSCNAINALSNAGIFVTYQTVYNYKKKIASKTNVVSMPARYSTPFPSSYNSCDCYHQLLTANNDKIVLICEHGYHIECYKKIEERCHYCLNYYKDGIWHNVDAFLECLNSEKNIDIKDLNNQDKNDQDNTADKNDLEKEGNRLDMSKKEKLDLELQNKIIEIDN
ncbi:23498_t:CDS:2, partial [Cetraspora pellucida]